MTRRRYSLRWAELKLPSTTSVVSASVSAGRSDVRGIEELPELSQHLYALDLETQARERIVELTRKIETAITHPRLSPLVEDYYLFIIEVKRALVSRRAL